MTNPQKQKLLTVDEYLALEASAMIRHEFVNGRIFAMSGGTKQHNIISLNIVTALRNALRGSGCAVYMADVKVRIDSLNSFYYPDVVVECKNIERSNLFTETPVFIAEVLSPSTASIDRREKLIAYQAIESLSEYLLVHQGKKRVELFCRTEECWTLHELVGDGVLNLLVHDNGEIVLSSDEIYEGIDFSEPPNLHFREEAEAYSW